MSKKHLIALSLSLFYLLLFIPFLGQVHLFDWDEINFAEAAREMLVTGDWLNVQINYEPFWEKPPLFIWMQAICMSIFGVSEFAARFPNVIIGLLSILSLYYIGVKHYSKQIAIAAVLLYLGAFTPHLYFKSGIIDPLFNLLIFHSIYQLIMYSKEKARYSMFLAGLFLGLSVLAKGPVSILIVGLCGLSYQLIYKHNFYGLKALFHLLIGLILIPGIWFGAQVYINGWWFIQEFVVYQIELFSKPVASHGQPFYYHPLVLLIGCFPLFILAFGPLFTPKAHSDDSLMQWMKVLFWVVLILFSAVTTKIVHYSSLCYLPLALLTANWVCRIQQINIAQRLFMILISLLWVIGLFSLAHLGYSPEFMQQLISLIQDDFVRAQLATEVDWSIFHYAFALVFLALNLYLIFNYNKLNLMSYLTFNTLFISMLMIQIVPKVEKYTQASWIEHLESYQGKEMIHLTQGFKSYAHIYYSKQQNSEKISAIKQSVLNKMNKESFYDLEHTDRQEFDFLLRTEVINNQSVKFSISAKLSHKEELNQNPELKQVFEGNGYGVWEGIN